MERSTREDARKRAAAFRDAVRHILAEEGRFTLADGEDPNRFWTWDGVDWTAEVAAAPISRSAPSSDAAFREG
jgi:hypothetical protein